MAIRRVGLRALLPSWWREALNPGAAVLRRFVRQASTVVPTGALLLDAGAGEGRYKDLFAHCRYIGADFALGDPSWDYSGLDVVCDLACLPFRASTFDAVLCTQVLEHVPEPAQVLSELSRCTKPGGLLVLTAPLTSEEHQQPYDFYRYTSYGLTYLLEKAGFCVEGIERLGGHLHLMALVTPRLNNFLWARWSRLLFFPLYAMSKLLLGAVLPLLLYHLDACDREKLLAMNFGVVARKTSDPS
ncbi:MAG: class I SAM-dependent methyltransferase [Armatimonadota bacterium]